MGNKWTLALNLTGIPVRDPLQVGLPTGIYKVQIADTETQVSDDPTKGTTIKVTGVVTEGEHKGAELLTWLGTDVTKKGVLRSWKTFLMAIGVPPAMLEAPCTVSPEALQGKVGQVFVRAKNPEEKDGYDQRDWVTVEMATKVETMLRKTSAPAGTAGAAAGVQQGTIGGVTPQPNVGGAQATGGGLRF